MSSSTKPIRQTVSCTRSENSRTELSETHELALDETGLFTFRLSETFLHELLHAVFDEDGAVDPNFHDKYILTATKWIREWMLYGEWPL